MLSKNVDNKICASKLLVFINEKKTEKDSDNFWDRKLTLKVKFWHFLTPPHYTNSQKKILVCWFLGKNISNFVPPAWKLNNPYYHNLLRSKDLAKTSMYLKCMVRQIKGGGGGGGGNHRISCTVRTAYCV